MSKTTKKPETKTAAAVFAERKVDVEAKLARVNAAIAKRLANQNPNWAETSDLGRYQGWLNDMLEKRLANQNPNWAETADLGRYQGWLNDMLEVLEGNG